MGLLIGPEGGYGRGGCDPVMDLSCWIGRQRGMKNALICALPKWDVGTEVGVGWDVMGGAHCCG